MGFIQEFFAKFKRRKVAKQLRRFIDEWEVLLPIFQQIEANNNDTAVASILRGHKRYEELTKYFDLLVIKVEQHNTEIRTLQTQFDEIIAKHSKKQILAHIDLYPLEQLQQFNDIALKISRFTIPDSFSQKQKYLRYMLDIGELVNDYKKIIEQFSLIRDFESLDFSFDDIYIDKNTAEKILSPAREILNQAKAYGTKYYTIPELDEKIVDRHNEKFIKNHLNDAIFNSINGKSLDEDQRRAILCDPKSNLTIAGAGAGKTLTICGKVKWLLETGKATADDILLMSYSKESANDLAVKVDKICKGLTVKTFHSLGLEILNRFNGSKRAINDQFNAYIKKFFDKELVNNPDTANAIFRFFSLYLYTNSISEKKYADDGEKFEDMKKSDYFDTS